MEEIKEQERLKQEENDRIDAEFEAEIEKENEQLIFETQMIPETNIEITTVSNNETYTTEIVSSRIIEKEATLEETSAIEAKIKQATEEIKPKSAFIPLVFKKG